MVVLWEQNGLGKTTPGRRFGRKAGGGKHQRGRLRMPNLTSGIHGTLKSQRTFWGPNV
jgi:hypothetical protein